MIRVDTTDNDLSLDLTPIIDMVFLLLIFFLVATTFQQTEREMQVALPGTTNSGPISASLREIIVNVDVDGSIIVSGRTLPPDELEELVRASVERNPDQKVTIRGDKNTAYANIVRVLDICKGAGIQEPYLDTVLEN